MKKLLIRLLLIISILILVFIALKNIVIKENASKNYPVKIGIIDSIINDKTIREYDKITIYQSKIDDEPITTHGESILSIISEGNNSIIFYVPVLDNNLEANIQDVVDAIYWCIDQKVDIINMSFSTLNESKMLKEAIECSIANNIIVVSSCINYYSYKSYPASYEGVISVSEGDYNEAKIVVKKREYAIKLSDGSTTSVNGTSFATAYVTNKIAENLKNYGKNSSLEYIISIR